MLLLLRCTSLFLSLEYGLALQLALTNRMQQKWCYVNSEWEEQHWNLGSGLNKSIIGFYSLLCWNNTMTMYMSWSRLMEDERLRGKNRYLRWLLGPTAGHMSKASLLFKRNCPAIWSQGNFLSNPQNHEKTIVILSIKGKLTDSEIHCVKSSKTWHWLWYFNWIILCWGSPMHCGIFSIPSLDPLNVRCIFISPM